MNVKKVKTISFLAANMAFSLMILGAATDHWVGRENEKIHVHEGLFRKCVHHKHNERVICMKPYRHSIPVKLLLTTILLIVTTIFYCIADILYVYLLYTRKEYNEKLEKGLALVLLGALVTLIAAIISYMTYYKSNYYSLKWSYAVCWGAVIGYCTALVFQIIFIVKMGEEEVRGLPERSISLPLHPRRKSSTLYNVLEYFRRRSEHV